MALSDSDSDSTPAESSGRESEQPRGATPPQSPGEDRFGHISALGRLRQRCAGAHRGNRHQVQVQVHIFRIVPHSGLVFDSLTFVTKITRAGYAFQRDRRGIIGC